MPRLPVILALSHAGCGGDATTDTTDLTDTTDVVEKTETADTAGDPPLDLTGQVGSVVVGHRGSIPQGFASYSYGSTDGAAEYYARGLFADALGGFIDATYCILLGAGCVTEYPAVGKAVTLPDADKAYFAAVNGATILEAGSEIEVGGLTLDRQAGGAAVYAATPTGLPTTGSLVFGGDLLAYSGTDDVPNLDGLLKVTGPDPSAEIDIVDGDTVTFTWTPGGAGRMFLQTRAELIALEDTGTYEFSVDRIDLASPLDTQFVTLTRLAEATIDAGGNAVSVQVRSDQPYVLNYRDTKGYTDLVDGVTIAGDCKSAKGLTPLGTGDYVGDNTAYSNDLDPLDYNSATGYAAAGKDGVVRIDMVKGERVFVTYRQASWDSSVYLLGDDCDMTMPLAGADATYAGDDEEFSYTAPETGTYYLVADTWSRISEGGAFSLELRILD